MGTLKKGTFDNLVALNMGEGSDLAAASPHGAVGRVPTQA